MSRIVQLIPYDAIGGVEIAAKSIPIGDQRAEQNRLRFERHYLVNRSGGANSDGEHHGPNRSLYDPRPYLHAVWRLFRMPPDLLVVSLWRCALVLIALKVLRPRQRSVLFLHSARDVHVVDKVVTRIAMRMADGIWVDSTATLLQRVPAALHHKGRVISFLLRRSTPSPPSNPVAKFIFWGRLSPPKALDRALRLFAKLVIYCPEAQLQIIGPDGGVGAALKSLSAQLGIAEQVHFTGTMDQAQIRVQAQQASFYLQTSTREGMALSVVEAMQMGLVPVVTPVGEIAQYCADGQNAIFIQQDSPEDMQAVRATVSLLRDPLRYRQMAQAAAVYWQVQPLYRDSFLDAAAAVIAQASYDRPTKRDMPGPRRR